MVQEHLLEQLNYSAEPGKNATLDSGCAIGVLHLHRDLRARFNEIAVANFRQHSHSRQSDRPLRTCRSHHIRPVSN